MRARTAVTTLLASLSLAAPILAGPSATRHYTDADIGGAAGNAANEPLSLSIAWNYRLRRMDISGSITPLAAGIRTSELRLKITPPASMGSPITLTPTVEDVAMIPGQTYAIEGVFTAFPGNWTADGIFTVEPHLTVDHGQGVDARWESLILTVSGAGMPPAIAPEHDLGILAGPHAVVNTTLPNFGKVWLRFTIPASVGQTRDTNSIDIDTLGTLLDHQVSHRNDPRMWLFDAAGNLLVVSTDIDAPGGNEQDVLSFGTGPRPAGAGATALISTDRIGSSGSLDEGTYYLLLMSDDPASIVSPAFTAIPGGPHFGPVTINIRSTFPARCDADFNKSGQISVQDIYDFLSAWNSGCP